ncbi:pentatricopeptide repeat-containing protein At5g39710-like [Cornus florida]|uniref:pentatricopeptide repeat-containing protein At5g39710-like n=1 Tax=Cornus florida TaxID=4283 RepID=UPI00289DBB7D|nr:pentatricopeptide repeat-containing protein At5g39710-like [Cornus florida]
MALACRALSLAKRGFESRRQWHLIVPLKSQVLICCNNYSSISSPLITRLLQEPKSRIKATLDSEGNNFTSEFSWDALITALKSSSSTDKAQLVLEWRLEKLLRDNVRDHDCYSELIYLFGKVQNVSAAMHVFTSMEAHGIRPSSAVFNALIAVFLSSGNIITALSLFEIMENSEGFKPNSDTYNAFISVHANTGNDKAMQAWYTAKRNAGFSADLRTYESLVSGCVKLKQFDAADKFYEEMILSGITPNLFILESMLVGLCEQRNLDKVKEFLMFIVNGGWKINGYTTQKLVGLYGELGRVEELEELLLSLMKCNQLPEVMSRVHCGIIRMYAMLDRLDNVEYSVGRMLEQGISFRCPDDVEKVICSYFRKAAYDRLDLFLERIRGSHKLTRSTYNLLVAGYRRAGLSEKVIMMMDSMKLAGFS